MRRLETSLCSLLLVAILTGIIFVIYKTSVIETEHLHHPAEEKDIILLMGNTGSGISTFTQFMATDIVQLRAVEKEPGQFVIVDENNKISNSAIISKTVLSDVIVDEKSHLYLADCPGFRNTRGVSQDIAATQLMHRVVEKAENVKIIFVVSYASLRSGGDCRDFMALLKHATDFIRNVDKLNSSVGLVVTKVDNTYQKKQGVPTLVTDKQVKSGIAEFLDEIKADIKAELSDKFANVNVRSLAMKMIDVFLSKSGDNLNFELFRRPDKAGPLSENELLMGEKKRLENLVPVSTKFVPVYSDDFGFVIWKESESEIYNLVDEINEQVASDVMIVVQQIKTHLRNKELESPQDAWQLRKRFREDYRLVQLILNKPGHSMKHIFEKLVTIVEISNTVMSAEPLKRIENNIKYLNFLQSVIDDELKVRTSDWEKLINSTLDNIRFSRNCYEYLVKLHEILSGFEFQEDTSKYNVADLNDWGKPNRPQGIHISANNFDHFMNISDTLSVEFNETKEEYKVDCYKILILNGLLQVLFKHEAHIQFEGDKLIAKGSYIKLSSVSGKLNETASSHIKSIEIYAQNSVFIDENLIVQGRLIDLAILATKWVVVGTREIVLGEVKAPNITEIGTRGRSSGRNSGTFFGVGMQFANGKRLTISANGGKRDQGQKDDNGRRWLENVIKKLPANANVLHMCDQYRSYSPNIRCDDAGRRQSYGDNYCQDILNYNVYGLMGRGGDVLPGGEVVSKSSISIVALQDTADFVLQIYSGCVNNVRSYIKREMSSLVPRISVCSETNDHYIEKTDCELFSGGSYPNPSQTINTFKYYLREYLNTDVQKLPISEMLTTIENSSKIATLYDIIGFVHALQSLEDQFFRLQSKVDFLPSYQYLSNMIISFAKKLQKTDSSLENRKVLNYLYIATLSKISNLKNVTSGFHIIDIKAYLDLAITNINTWQDITLKETIQQHNQDYQHHVDKKIESANEFIKTQITDEFDNINKQIEGQIDRLLNEVRAQKQDAKTNQMEMEKGRRELKHAMNMRLFFGSLKTGSSALSFFGPLGAAVGGLVGIGTSVAESLSLDKNAGGHIKRTVVLSGVKTLLESAEVSVKAIRDSRIAALNVKLDILTRAMDKYPSQLRGVDDVKEINRIKSRLTSVKSDKELNLTTILELDTKVNTFIKNKRHELFDKKSKSGPHRMKRDVSSALGYINTASNVANAAIDVYNKYKDDEVKLEAISAAIDGEQEAIDKLQQYEGHIHSVMKPLISLLSDDVKQLEGELGGKSQVGLDVAKWQIQTKIRDMKLQMQQFTRGYELEENMARCFEKLDEAMSVLITVYDRIQDFQEQKKLADLITAVGSPAADAIQINNAEMSRAVNRLELMIKSNIILSQYARAVSSFKQFVFPFADSYLQEYTLPSDIQVGNSTHLLVEKAVRNIRSLRAKITESGAVINNNKDTHVYDHEFNSRHNTTSSFHVWKSDSYHEEISSLLSGKEIALKAAITDDNDLNAVKFNLIRLHLKTENGILQKDLNATLQFYKVSLSHLGNSYYRCDGRFYVIPSDSVTIEYSFKLNGQGEPQTRNEVYNKLKKGDITLSPYAMWKIKLIGRSYDRLEQFQNKVDVELEGHGTYVGKDAKVCASNLDTYYTADDSMSYVKNMGIYLN